MFIALLQYIKPLEDIEKHIAEHREFLDKYYAAGKFIASGPQIPRVGGAILVKGVSRQEVEALILEDPFHREQVASYQIIEFTPTKLAKGADDILQ